MERARGGVMMRAENTTNTTTLSLRNLLKEASALKKEKKYSEACDKLREAYSVVGENNLTISDRLRLPMYLQLAGRADEGWGELNRLIITHVDQYSQISIAAHMAKFLRNEGKYKTAVLFSVWELCMRKEIDMDAHAYIVHRADQKPKQAEERKSLGLPPSTKDQR
jgi:hypothetical protein